MNANKSLWEQGDFTRLAQTMRNSGAALVGDLGIKKDMVVLDLGCGDGTTAVPAAKLGADVLGVDIASNLVAAGNRRAILEGLANLRFQEGDASDLHDLQDDRFDLVVSIFGAMFAPHPDTVAQEMVRVTRPGGRIVMGNWIPGDPTLVAQILRISASYSPPPPAGFVSPMLWGQEAEVLNRFGRAGIAADDISFTRGEYRFEYAGTPTDFLDTFVNYYGPTMNAMAAAERGGRSRALKDELGTLFDQQNISPNKDLAVMPATYLRVTVQVR